MHPDIERVVAREFTRNQVRRGVRRLQRQVGLSNGDRDDLEQELWLQLLRRSARFDPERGCWNAFVTTVVRRCADTLARRLVRDRRQRCHESDQLERLAEDCLRRPEPHDEFADLERRDAVQAVLADLTKSDRDVCDRLQHDTVSDVARALGTPRSTLVDRVRRLRRKFAVRGLEIPSKLRRDRAKSGGREE